MRDLVEKKCRNLDLKKYYYSELADISKISFLNKGIAHYKKNQLRDQLVVQYSGNHGRTHDLLSLVKAAEILKDNEDIKFLFIDQGVEKTLVNYAINMI